MKRSKQGMNDVLRQLGIGVVAVLLALGSASAQDATVVQQQLTVEAAPAQRSLADVAAPPSGLRVTAWVDQQDNTYEVGETLTLTVQSNADAFVTVLNNGTNGQTTVIFPNRFQSDNRVPANKPFRIPAVGSGSVLRVGGPAGTDLIKVIASSENVPVLEGAALESAGAYEVATQSTDEIAEAVQMTIGVETAPPHQDISWATYNKVIRVVERTASAPVTPPAQTPTPAPSPQAFTLKVQPDRSVYRIGEPINLQVTASRDCHLTVLNVDAAQQARRLFPNRFQTRTKIAAGLTVLIPGNVDGVQFLAQEPAGQDTITAICTTEPKTVVPATASEPFAVIGDSSVVNQAVAVVRTRPQGETAVASAVFQVIPAQ